MKAKLKSENVRRRKRRATRIRKKVEGSGERPRLAVFRSAKHIYAQIIDDVQGKTVVTASTLTPDLQEALKGLKKTDASVKVGAKVAELAKAVGVSKVVFDRKGYPYHGRVAALAKGAREAGLEF